MSIALRYAPPAGPIGVEFMVKALHHCRGLPAVRRAPGAAIASQMAGRLTATGCHIWSVAQRKRSSVGCGRTPVGRRLAMLCALSNRILPSSLATF